MAALNFPNGPSVGDKYPTPAVVGQPQYTWDGEKWTTIGIQVTNATPSATVPLMDATPGLPGAAAAYSRGDHVHPTDTTRAALTYVDGNLVAYNAAQTTTSTQRAQARANIHVLKRNYIINGGMMISQENGTTSSTVSSYYPVDQFLVAFVNAATQASLQYAVPTPGGSPYRLRYTVPTVVDTTVAAADYAVILQYIEGFRVADLLSGTAAAKTITIQFGVRAPAGTYCVGVRNNAYDRSYVAEYTIAAGEALVDTVKSVVIPLDTTGTWETGNLAGFRICWTLMGGSNFQTTPGSWKAGSFYSTANQFNLPGVVGGVFELFDVSLTEGPIAPPFQVPDYASELALCQRYYEKTYPTVDQPGKAYGAAAGGNAPGMYMWAVGSFGMWLWPFKVTKRGIPTVTVYSPWTGASGKMRDQNGGVDVTAGPSATSPDGTFLGISVSVTASNFVYGHATANARL